MTAGLRPEDLYPMNQDGVAPEALVYGSALWAIASKVRQDQEVTGSDLDTALAQVELDLRQMLDRSFVKS